MKLVQPSDFNNKQFTVSNDIQIKQTPNTYTVTFTANAEPGDLDSDGRRYIEVSSGGFGFIHLDFKPKSSGGIHLANLPREAPTPRRLIEVKQDGMYVWVDAGSRKIMGNKGVAGQRYIVNIPGFFTW